MVLASIMWCGRSSDGLFRAVGIPEVLPGIAFIKECGNEPNKKHQRNHNGHDQVLYFFSKVHENTNNIKCFRQRKDNNNPFQKQFQAGGHGYGIHPKTHSKFNQGDNGQDYRCFDDLADNLFSTWFVVKRDFLYCVFHMNFFKGWLDEIEAKEYKYPYQVYKMPVKAGLFNHPVMALPFKGSIDRHDQHHNVDDHSRSYVETMKTGDTEEDCIADLV